MTIAPSAWRRRPANVRNRSLTSSARDERFRSNRSSTAVATLLTFCPPGPDARTNRSLTSLSSIETPGAIGMVAIALLVERGRLFHLEVRREVMLNPQLRARFLHEHVE